MQTKIPLNLLAGRRQKIFSLMQKASALVLFSNSFTARNADVDYSFRQDSNFWYTTGFNEADSILVLKKDFSGEENEYLYILPKDKTMEIWTGTRAGRSLAAEITGIKNVFENDKFKASFSDIMKNTATIYTNFTGQSQIELKEFVKNEVLQSQRRSATENIQKIVKADTILGKLRNIKDKWEIEQMRKSAEIACLAHNEGIKTIRNLVKSGKTVWEYQLEAELYKNFKYQGCDWSYPAIVAGGKNACILHYLDNNQQLKPGELVLIDAGCEYNYYASDITRVYPINGKFSQSQKIIYELVHSVNEACIAEIARPGATYKGYHEKSVELLTKGLIDLKILKGGIEENLEKKTYFDFYMHGIGHWLGLDVHDLSTYLDEDGRRVNTFFEPGMTVTVEPGLYFSPENENIPKEFRGIGIRIEDDILKTKSGVEVLTKSLPKNLEEIEKLCS